MVMDNLELTTLAPVQPEPVDTAPVVDAPDTSVGAVVPDAPSDVPSDAPPATGGEDEYYTDEEFEALPEPERKEIWIAAGGTEADFNARYAAPAKPQTVPASVDEKPTLDAVLSNLLNLQDTYQKKIEEGEKITQKRLAELAEASKGHPEAEERYKNLKAFDKGAKETAKDGTRVSPFLVPKVYYTKETVPAERGENPSAHAQRIEFLNNKANWARNQQLVELEDIVSAIIEPYKPLLDRVAQTVEIESNDKAWYETALEVVQDMKLSDDEIPETLDTLRGTIVAKKLLDKGSKIEPEIRRELIRAMILSAPAKPPNGKPASQTFQFKKNPASGNTGKPTNGDAPRRKKPPRTLGGIGTHGAPTPGQVKSKVDAVFGADFSINQ